MAARALVNVVFDLGGVLIDWNPRYLFRKLLDGEEAVARFLDTVCTRTWYVQHDAGLPFAEGVASLVKQHPEHAALIRAFDERWAETLGDAIDGAVAVLADLRARDVPLYALTNWPADKFRHAEEKYDFLRWFRGIVVSGVEGVSKPDPRIFRLLLDRYRLTAEQTVFIDDSPQHVAAAADLGLHGIRFQSPEQLRCELAELGLL